MANTGSNQHFFGLGHGRISDARAKSISDIASRHGADFIRYAEPSCVCGYGCRPFCCAKAERFWFAAPNRGEPFDSATAHDVEVALKTVGLWPVCPTNRAKSTQKRAYCGRPGCHRHLVGKERGEKD